jgi:hypothetical protein
MSLKNRFLIAGLVTLPILVVGSPAGEPFYPIASRAEDRETCSNATMHGSYGFHATGRAGLVVVGRFVFDGNGGLVGKLFIRVPGKLIGPVEFTGTYSVGPDCIMTDDWGGGNVHISAIVEQGKGYFIMNTPGPTEIANPAEDSLNNGEGRRQ